MKVRIGEDSIGGSSLSMRATLTSPPGTNYDLFIHTKKGGGCGVVAKSSTNITGTDSIYYSQPDVIVGDDDYYVLMEVRHISGDCTPTAKWRLLVEGNK